MRVGFLGGTFDPVHMGHLVMGEEARIQLELDRVLFVPAGQPWLKEGQPLSTVPHRVEMLRMAVSCHPDFQLCLEEINRSGPTYTVDTLEALLRELGSDTTIYFIVGQDAMKEFHRWKEPEKLLALCQLVVATRPGYQNFDWDELVARFPEASEKAQLLSMPLMGMSGTDIRRRAAAGVPLRYQVPDSVAEYIEQHGLYVQWQRKDSDIYASAAIRREDIIEGLLEVALVEGALKYGDFMLSSGKKSKYYFDGRLLSLYPKGSQLIVEALLPILDSVEAEAIGGLTLGADPIVSAVALASGLRGKNIPGFIVRKEAKGHGTGQSIEGPLRPGSRVAIVDDVCTTGGSLFQAIDAVEAVGCTVVKVVALLDRREGGSDELRRRGYDFVALLEADSQGYIKVVDIN